MNTLTNQELVELVAREAFDEWCERVVWAWVHDQCPTNPWRTA